MVRSAVKALVWRLFSTAVTVSVALLVLHDTLQVGGCWVLLLRASMTSRHVGLLLLVCTLHNGGLLCLQQACIATRRQLSCIALESMLNCSQVPV
jgi:hypothetical protein